MRLDTVRQMRQWTNIKMQDVLDSVASVASWYAAYRRSCKWKF